MEESTITRKIFLRDLIDSVFVHHSLVLNTNISNPSSKPETIEYVAKDILNDCIACNFRLSQMEHIKDLFAPIFMFNAIEVVVPFKLVKTHTIEFYQSRARKYIKSLVKDNGNIETIVDKLPLSVLSDLFDMIIDEIFFLSDSTKPADDLFESQKCKICKNIKNALIEYHNNTDLELSIRQYDNFYCFISKELNQYSDIEQYQKAQNLKYLDLKKNNITEFISKVIYRYDTICYMDFFPDTTPCCSWVDLSFTYNSQHISLRIPYEEWNTIDNKMPLGNPDYSPNPMTLFFIFDNNSFKPILIT